MTKTEIFEKLKREYLNKMSMAEYIKYSDTQHSTTEEGKQERLRRVEQWENDAHQMVPMMWVLELPKKWITDFEDSQRLLTWEYEGVIQHGDSIPYDAREMHVYQTVMGLHAFPKRFDEDGNFIKRDNNVLDILCEQTLAA
jgi:hypothetical protein